jgi:phosphoribosylglycinamide formyltransferase 2
VEGESDAPVYHGLNEAMAQPDTQIRLFGKPNIRGRRRMGVALASGLSIEEARTKAQTASRAIAVEL